MVYLKSCKKFKKIKNKYSRKNNQKTKCLNPNRKMKINFSKKSSNCKSNKKSERKVKKST